LGFLRDELDAAAEVPCAMRESAAVYGEWSHRHAGWRWQKLHVAAAHVGFGWDGDGHKAIKDGRATRVVWRYLCRSADAGADRGSGRCARGANYLPAIRARFRAPLRRQRKQGELEALGTDYGRITLRKARAAALLSIRSGKRLFAEAAAA
jgi:hypothetical protein